MKIEDGLYRVDGVRGANAYLLEQPDGLTLIDAGMPGSTSRIIDFIQSLGHEASDLHDIVITHSDLDHIGNVDDLRRLTGARISIAAEDAPVLRGEPSPKIRRGLLDVVFKILLAVMKPKPAEPDVLLADGDVVAGLRVMSVPGHTPGSIALVREDGVVFSGDTLLGGPDGHLLGPHERLSLDIEMARASAEQLKALSPRLVLPGHGGPVRLG